MKAPMSAPSSKPVDLIVLHEHPEWQKPLFAALERRGVSFKPFDLKAAAFDEADVPEAKLYFSQASPSAYLRGNARAVPLALALMKNLEEAGARVLNGSRAFALELSKSAQAALLRKLGLRGPRTITFNDAKAARARAATFPWPALLKPDQGGSGARMFLLETVDELERLLDQRPELWLPDNLLLLQEKVPYDASHGIIRMEFVGGELLYAMRVVSHGSFNLCPSELCNPVDGVDGACAVPEVKSTAPVEFYPYPEVSPEAVEAGRKIVRAGGLDVAGLEFIETREGPVFYDINANSNLRAPIAAAFGFDPFERVVDFLERELGKR
jgi:glutathione synthase/RimK-type ligase-like ATP-grasp enzyme